MAGRAQWFVPDESQLQDPQTLMKHLLDASAYARGTVDGVGFARLLEAAAQALQQQTAEAKVARGLPNVMARVRTLGIEEQVSEAEAREIFDTADLDGGGTIDFDEFSEVMRE